MRCLLRLVILLILFVGHLTFLLAIVTILLVRSLLCLAILLILLVGRLTLLLTIVAILFAGRLPLIAILIVLLLYLLIVGAVARKVLAHRRAIVLELGMIHPVTMLAEPVGMIGGDPVRVLVVPPLSVMPVMLRVVGAVRIAPVGLP